MLCKKGAEGGQKKKKMAAQRQAMKGLPHGNATAIAQILALAFSAIQKCWKNRIY